MPRDEARPRFGARTPKDEAPFLDVLRSRPAIWGILIGTFCYSCYLYFCITWLPAYFKEQRNLPLDLMGLYTMFSFSGMAVTTILCGWVADRLIARGDDPVRVRKTFTIVGLLVAATEVFGASAESAQLALFFSIFSLAGLGHRDGELLGAYSDGCSRRGDRPDRRTAKHGEQSRRCCRSDHDRMAD